jgi:hypothetical protein
MKNKEINFDTIRIVGILLLLSSILMVRTLFTTTPYTVKPFNFLDAKTNRYSVNSNEWSENFEDGNYSEWTVLDGMFNASSKILLATGNDTDYHRIRHDSNISYGTWSFDVQINRTSYIFPETIDICFLMESYEQLENDPKNKGYYLGLMVDARNYPRNKYNVHLVLIEGMLAGKFLGSFLFPSERLNTNHHIDITRNTNGHFNVLMDGTLIIEGMDDESIQGNYFGFNTHGGQGLDNITVNNEITVEPKATDLAKLRFTVDSNLKTIKKESLVSETILVKNEGHATGYGTLVLGSQPSGITVEFFGSNQITGLENNDTKEIPISIKTEASVKPGIYNVSIELKKSSEVIDTLILSIEIPSGNGIQYGVLIWSILLPMISIIIFRRRQKQNI